MNAVRRSVIRRLLSGFLTVCLIFGLFPELAITAQAADKKLGKASLGSTVIVNENGVPAEFIVAKHNYNSDLNGDGRTLLVRKQPMDAPMAWGNADSADMSYGGSNVDIWCSSYYMTLDPFVRNAAASTLIHAVNRFGYPAPASATGSVVITISRSVFLLSAVEFGQTAGGYMHSEGSALSTFGLFSRSASEWTRTLYSNTGTAQAYVIKVDGTSTSATSTSKQLVRPAFTLPADSIMVASDGSLYSATSSVTSGLLSDVVEGTVIKLEEKDGTFVEFIVAKHNYNSDLNGDGVTLLVRRQPLETSVKYGSAEVVDLSYGGSIVDILCNSYYNMLSAAFRSVVVPSKILVSEQFGFKWYEGAADGYVREAVIERSCFLLSAGELGMTYHNYGWSEGTMLTTYGLPQDRTVTEWTRTIRLPYTTNASAQAIYVTADNALISAQTTASAALRPAITVDPTRIVIETDGTARVVSSYATSGPLATIVPGTVVTLNENGSPVKFVVAAHDYNADLNGDGVTLLIRADSMAAPFWCSDNSVIKSMSYGGSGLDLWCSSYMNALDLDVRHIMATTKIVVTDRFSFKWSEGDSNTYARETVIERSCFLLSAGELGARHIDYGWPEGTTLTTYGLPQDRTVAEWTRTLSTLYTTNQNATGFAVRPDGTLIDVPANTCDYAVRPVIAVRAADAVVTDDGVLKPVGSGAVSTGMLDAITPGCRVTVFENGSPVEFVVAAHNYGADLNGDGLTLLVRSSPCSDELAWGSSSTTGYAGSVIDTWLNGTYLWTLDADLRDILLTYTTKIPVVNTFAYNTSGATETVLDRSVFSLSLYELGCEFNSSCWPEGSSLTSYGVVELGSAREWTRTLYTDPYSKQIWCLSPSTSTNFVAPLVVSMTGTGVVRPAFALPSRSVVVGSDGVLSVVSIVESTLTVDPAGGTWNGNTDPVSYTQESDTTVDIPVPTRPGYVFAGWSRTGEAGAMSSLTDAATYTFGYEEDAVDVITATWTAATDIAYKIEHYYQNLTGTGYELGNTENKQGTTDSTVAATSAPPEGFTENATHTDRKATGQVAADGSLVLKLYYDRKVYTVTIDPKNGTSASTQTVIHGNVISEPVMPGRPGYTFTGWKSNGSTFDFSTLISGNITLEAGWTANTNTQYKVEHYYQKVDGSGYAIANTETLYGTTDTTVTATADVPVGFTENTTHEYRIASGKISGNGGLVLRLYYDRNSYTVTIDPNDGNPKTTQTVLHGALATKPVNPSKPGYTFVGWRVAGAVFTFSTPITGDIDIVASLIANTDTPYKIEHYKQNADKTGYELAKTDNLTGTTDSIVRATVNSTLFSGFLENPGHPDRVAEGTVTADGKLVLKLYYDRNEATITFDPNNGEATSTQVVLYGTLVSKPADPVKLGYTFGGWMCNGSLYDFTKPVSDDADLIATWTANTNTAYKIEHYHQNVDGNGYTLADTDSMTGITDTTATAVPDIPVGFTENKTHADRVVSDNIAADGSLVLKLYYDRNSYTVTIKPNDGNADTTQTVLHGGLAMAPANPSKAGYTFNGWFVDGSAFDFSTPITGDTEIIASVTANTDTPYKVEHYQQNIDRNGYTLVKTDNLQGTTDTITKVTVNSALFTGFTENTGHPDRKVQGTVTADGSLVLRVYYDRNSVTVVLDPANGESTTTLTLAYGDTVSEPSPAPVREGYTFTGWKVDGVVYDFTQPVTENLNITATWVANSGTAYKVQHYHQNVDGNGYTLAGTDDLTGTTDTTATAVANIPTGFTENLSHAERIASGNIAPDGSLVLKLYYDRNAYAVIVRPNDGNPDTTETVLHGGLATAPAAEPSKPGYTFNGWFVNGALFDFSMPIIADTEIIASVTPNTNTPYKVEHYQQNIDRNGYTLAKTDNLQGTTDTITRVTINSALFTGFTENTSHPDRKIQGTVTADGSLVLRVYYDRNSVTVTIDPANGESVTTLTLAYGAIVSVPSPEPVRVGYAFMEWQVNGTSYDFTQPVTENLNIKAAWIADGDTRYQVQHYYQTVDGADYELLDTKNLSGVTDSTIAATPEVLEGFKENKTHADRVASGVITADGGLVLKLYYDRIVYSVIINPMSGDPMTNESVLHGARVSHPASIQRQGYIFTGWIDQNGNPFDFHNHVITSDMTITGTWAPATDTPYKIEHYKMTLDGTGYELIDVENEKGTTDTTITGQPNVYQGFNTALNHGNLVSMGIVEADGSLVLRFYYDRQTMNISMDPNNGQPVITASCLYEQTVTAPEDPVKQGYTFAGWEKIEPPVDDIAIVDVFFFDFTAPVMESVNLIATYTANGDIAYKVQHYQQRADASGYDLFETEDLTGVTDDTVYAIAKTYAGFIENTSYTDRVASGVVLADGSLILKLYYDRADYVLTMNPDNGESVAQQAVTAGNAPVKPVDPIKIGYDFAGWFLPDGTEFDFTAIMTESLTITARWTARTDTSYTVERYWQNVTQDGYELHDTTTLSGTTGQMVNATVEVYDGFIYNVDDPNQIASGVIAADGGLVLKLYYDRVTLTVTFDPNNGQPSFTQTVVYGGKLTRPADPTKQGHIFNGWSNGDAMFDFASEVKSAMTLTGAWSVADGIVYQVQHYHQGPDGYVLHETETLAGKTGDSVTAVPRVYDGFSENTAHPDRISTGIIQSDGSLVLKLYYARDKIKVEVNPDNSEESYDFEVDYGGYVIEPVDPVKTGYVFVKWVDESGNEFDFENTKLYEGLVLTAIWEAATDTVYKIMHYQQDAVGDGYTLYETDTLTGTTGSNVTAAPKTYVGFTENTTHSNRVNTGTIAADGSLVLKLYYDRQMLTITIDPDNGAAVQTLTVRYGGLVNRPADPEKERFEFVNWVDAKGNVFDFSKPVYANAALRPTWVEIKAPDVIPDTGLTMGSTGISWLLCAVVALLGTVIFGLRLWHETKRRR